MLRRHGRTGLLALAAVLVVSLIVAATMERREEGSAEVPLAVAFGAVLAFGGLLVLLLLLPLGGDPNDPPSDR
jgi:hypothetical protein